MNKATNFAYADSANKNYKEKQLITRSSSAAPEKNQRITMGREIKFSLVYRDMYQSSGKFQPLAEQLEKAGCMDRAELPFQKALLNRELPYTIGGGIGQSRICMFFLRKAHIGEVQSSIWTEAFMKEAAEKKINIL